MDVEYVFSLSFELPVNSVLKNLGQNCSNMVILDYIMFKIFIFDAIVTKLEF